MKTEIIAVLDRSGSMVANKIEAINGFNSFLSDQQKVDGEARLTVCLFDDRFESLYAAVPIADAKPLTEETFVPRGWTALYDAIGKTLNENEPRIQNEKWADKVIVVILTDGHENKSTEFTAANIKDQIKVLEASGWSFVFLAANVDAFAVGGVIGVSQHTTQQYDDKVVGGTLRAYAGASAMTASLRANPNARSLLGRNS